MMKRCVLVVLFVAIGLSVFAGPLMYRPGREHKTINTGVYEMVIQKNGCLSINLISGDAVFQAACPMVWFEGEEEPEPLEVDGRWSMREAVNDRLGKGQGMLLVKENCEWSIRSYTPALFFCVQVAYINTSNKPTRVKMLSPWYVGVQKKSMLSLGEGTDQSLILENSGVSGQPTDLRLVKGTAQSLWDVGLLNPTNGRSVIAGFLTHEKAQTQFQVERAEGVDATQFSLFQAECVFDPPVEVAPGGRLASEVLYISVGESNALVGMERYGDALAVANSVSRKKRFLPHGWDSAASEYGDAITEGALLNALGFMDGNLKRYGWTHFSVGHGWEQMLGNWEPDSARFGNGMKALADQVHARNMTAGLALNPFLVNRNAPVAKEHPDWLVAPKADWQRRLGPDVAILDVTAPGAEEYVRQLVGKVCVEWGYDALEGVDGGVLLGAEAFSDRSLTHVEVFQKGMRAVNEAAGSDRVIAGGAPTPLMGLHAESAGHGEPVGPIWRRDTMNDPMGAVEALTTSSEQYYFSPFLTAADPGCGFFGHAGTRQKWEMAARPELTWEQKVAWFTGLAMAGGVVKVGDDPPGLSAEEVNVLSKLLPPLDAPPRPVDLFEREQPQIWSLPVRSAIGDWVLVALFNWDQTAAQTLTLAPGQYGMNPEGYYTVFGFWEEKYYGLAHGEVPVTVPPGSVRLFSLRPYNGKPMFLSTNRHFSQGATDFTSLKWDEQQNRLEGTFEGVGETDYALRVLVPENYRTESVVVSGNTAQTTQEDNVLTIRFRCAESGPVAWSAAFRRVK